MPHLGTRMARAYEVVPGVWTKYKRRASYRVVGTRVQATANAQPACQIHKGMAAVQGHHWQKTETALKAGCEHGQRAAKGLGDLLPYGVYRGSKLCGLLATFPSGMLRHDTDNLRNPCTFIVCTQVTHCSCKEAPNKTGTCLPQQLRCDLCWFSYMTRMQEGGIQNTRPIGRAQSWCHAHSPCSSTVQCWASRTPMHAPRHKADSSSKQACTCGSHALCTKPGSF